MLSIRADKQPEVILFDEVLNIERKRFRVQKRRNHLGELHRIREESGRGDMLIVPDSGIDELIAALQRSKEAK